MARGQQEDNKMQHSSSGRFIAETSTALVIEWRLSVTTPGQGELGGIRFAQIGAPERELTWEAFQTRLAISGNEALGTIFERIKPTLRNPVFTGRVDVHSIDALDHENCLLTFVFFLRDVIVPTLRMSHN